MKAYDVYKRACAIMFEREGEDEAFFEKFPQLITLLAAEALPYENSVREAEKKEKLSKAPIIANSDDEIDMCDAICNTALPYGLAAYFYQDDGEKEESSHCRERFVSALQESARCCFRDIEDIYGGEDNYDI